VYTGADLLDILMQGDMAAEDLTADELRSIQMHLSTHGADRDTLLYLRLAKLSHLAPLPRTLAQADRRPRVPQALADAVPAALPRTRPPPPAEAPPVMPASLPSFPEDPPTSPPKKDSNSNPPSYRAFEPVGRPPQSPRPAPPRAPRPPQQERPQDPTDPPVQAPATRPAPPPPARPVRNVAVHALGMRPMFQTSGGPSAPSPGRVQYGAAAAARAPPAHARTPRGTTPAYMTTLAQASPEMQRAVRNLAGLHLGYTATRQALQATYPTEPLITDPAHLDALMDYVMAVQGAASCVPPPDSSRAAQGPTPRARATPAPAPRHRTASDMFNMLRQLPPHELEAFWNQTPGYLGHPQSPARTQHPPATPQPAAAVPHTPLPDSDPDPLPSPQFPPPPPPATPARPPRTYSRLAGCARPATAAPLLPTAAARVAPAAPLAHAPAPPPAPRYGGSYLPKDMVKKITIEKFNGTGDLTANEWLNMFERYARSHEVADQGWGEALLYLLSGSARRWAETLPPHVIDDYDLLRAEFEERYAAKARTVSLAEMNHIEMKDNETVMHFVDRVERSVYQALPGVPSAQLLPVVINAIATGVRPIFKPARGRIREQLTIQGVRSVLESEEAALLDENVSYAGQTKSQNKAPSSNNNNNKPPGSGGRHLRNMAHNGGMPTPNVPGSPASNANEPRPPIPGKDPSLPLSSDPWFEYYPKSHNGKPLCVFCGMTRHFRLCCPEWNAVHGASCRDQLLALGFIEVPEGFRRPPGYFKDRNRSNNNGNGGGNTLPKPNVPPTTGNFKVHAAEPTVPLTSVITALKRPSPNEFEFSGPSTPMGGCPAALEQTLRQHHASKDISQHIKAVQLKPGQFCFLMAPGPPPPPLSALSSGPTPPVQQVPNATERTIVCTISHVSRILNWLTDLNPVSWLMLFALMAMFTLAGGAPLPSSQPLVQPVSAGQWREHETHRSFSRTPAEVRRFLKHYEANLARHLGLPTVPPQLKTAVDVAHGAALMMDAVDTITETLMPVGGAIDMDQVILDNATPAPFPLPPAPKHGTLYDGLRPLAAPVNLGMGIAADPMGTALVSSSHVLVPIIANLAHPHFQPPSHRSPAWKDICPPSIETCAAVVESEVACSYNVTPAHMAFVKIVEQVTETYAGIVDTAYLSTIMERICGAHDGLCAERHTKIAKTNDTVKDAHGRRPKRSASIGAVTGLLGTAMAALNTLRISRVESNVKLLDHYMNTAVHTVNFLNKGFETLARQSIAVTEFMHHEILNTYRTMHAIRCETSTREQWLLDKVQLLEYETAMMRHVDAMINTALTGRITPLVLSSQHLRKLIEVHATLKQSLTAQQPALAYEFGRAIPVRLDLTSLRFAFILVLPTPRSHDVVTTFRVHNVGFYQKPEAQVKFIVPFPDFIALSQAGHVLPFRSEQCQTAPGVQYCPLGALTPSSASEECLRFFLNPTLAKPQDTYASNITWFRKMREHVGSECFDHLWVWGKDGEAAVRQTLAGLLIRASSNLDISYVPADAKETDSNLMPRRHPSHAENGVYWLPHNAYRYATVANFLYTPPESETYSFLTNFSLLSSMPIANYTFKTPGMASMAQVRAFDKLIKKYLDELPPLIDYPGINKLPVPEWAIYVALAISVIIFCCAAARCKKYCKNLKLRKKKEKKLSSVQETVVHFAANSSDSSSDGECVTLLGRTSRGVQTIYQAVRDSMPDYAYWAFWPFYWWFRKNERYYREQGYLEQTPTQVPDAYYRRTPPQLSIVAAKPENLPPRLPPLPGPRSDTAADQRSPSPTPRRRHRSNSASRKGQPSRPRSRSIEMVRIETAPPPRASKPPAKPSRTHPHVSSTDTSTTTVNIEAPPREPTPKATHPKGGRGLKRMSELTRIDQPDVHRAWVEHKLAHSSPVISGRAPGQPYTLEEWSDQLEKGGGKDEVNSLDPPLPNHLSEGGGKDEVNSLDSTLPSSTLPTLEELASTPSTSKEFTAEGTPANFAEPQPNKPKKKFAKLRLRAKIRSKELARNRTGRKPLCRSRRVEFHASWATPVVPGAHTTGLGRRRMHRALRPRLSGGAGRQNSLRRLSEPIPCIRGGVPRGNLRPNQYLRQRWPRVGSQAYGKASQGPN
jgi:hypothetical protein